MRYCQFFIFILFFLPPPAQGGELRGAIDRLLTTHGIPSKTRSRVSLQIVSLPDEKILYEKNPELALNPASNVKLVTAGAALHVLGPDYTFKTEFYSNTLLKNGALKNLWIKGHGDPVFVTEELESIVAQFKAAGLRQIDGRVYVDDTYFDHYNLTTYLSSVREKIYHIMTGPLSFNFNIIGKQKRPKSHLGDQSAISFRGSILDSATYTGAVIVEALKKAGITVRGDIQREAVSPNTLLILSHSSPPLREILKGLGKFSNNFIAEQLVKTLGAVRYGPPGSTSKGLEVLKEYLSLLDIPKGSYVLDNGSGLSKLTRLSASQLIKILKDLDQPAWREDVLNGLSISGIDGTLYSRMRRSPLRGKVWAKTGTLNGVNTLSGYIIDGPKKAAFSFLFNDLPLSPEKINRLQEKILERTLESL